MTTPVCTTCKDTHVMVIGDRTVPCTFCLLPCPRCRTGGNGAYCTTTPCPCTCHPSHRIPPQPIDSLIDIQRRFKNGIYESDDLDWVRGRLHDTVDAVLALMVTTEERLAALEGRVAATVPRCPVWWIPGVIPQPGMPSTRTRCTLDQHAANVPCAFTPSSPTAHLGYEPVRASVDANAVECRADRAPGSTAVTRLTVGQFAARADAWRTWLEAVPVWAHVEQDVIDELSRHLARVKRPPVGGF